MLKHITIIQGHPDPKGDRFCHALASAYAKGAEEAGHVVELVSVGELDFPVLRTKEDFETGQVPPSIQKSQEAIRQANHLVIFYPLWHGTMPALLKAFFEQAFVMDLRWAQVRTTGCRKDCSPARQHVLW